MYIFHIKMLPVVFGLMGWFGIDRRSFSTGNSSVMGTFGINRQHCKGRRERERREKGKRKRGRVERERMERERRDTRKRKGKGGYRKEG